METLIERDEIIEIFISVFAISLAFSLALAGGYDSFGYILSFPQEFLLFVVVSLVTIGSGFVLHEMGHKLTAIYYGAYAKFKMWTKGLVFMMLVSLIGVLFAAPGAVYIFSRRITLKQNGIISIAGPMVNVILMIFFLILNLVYPISLYFSFLEGLYLFGIADGLVNVWIFGALINLVLGLFNMIPAFPLDGSKIILWSMPIWAVMTFGMLGAGYVLGFGLYLTIMWLFLLVLALFVSKLIFRKR